MSSILPSQEQQERIFNIIVSCDWLLVSGSVFFLIVGILFAKFILLHNNGNQEELKKELEKMMIKGRLEVKKIEQEEEQKKQQQQQSEHAATSVDAKNDENKKEEATDGKTDEQTQTQPQPISLQLVPSTNSSSSACLSHPFSSHIPLGPQIENLTAAHSHPGRFMRSLGCELKMVIVVRRDFKPTESLAASWGSTVATEVVQHIRSSFQEPWMSWLKTWNHMAVAKVAVRVDSAEMMNGVIRRAVDVEEKKKELMNREVEKEKSNPWKVAPTSAEKNDKDDNKANENENSNNKNDDNDEKKTEEVGEKEVTVKEEKEVSKKEFKNCKFSLPVCGLVMTDKPQQDSAAQNNKKSSKKAGPTPSSKKGSALDVSKKQFSILSSKDLLAQISSSTSNQQQQQQQQQFDVPCLAIGPCPVDYFVGVTDTLKLY